jgi:hypothetical protein
MATTVTAPGRTRPAAAPARRRPDSTLARGALRPHPLESFLIFAIAMAAYFALGYVVIVNDHVVSFEALDRLTRAYMVWHDSPPKLAAVGFNYPPLTSLVFLGVALIKPLSTSLVALPLTSSAFAGMTMVVLNRTLQRCDLGRLLRYPLLLLFGLGPEFAFYASSGLPGMVSLFLLSSALYCFIAWYETEESRYLIGAGAAFALCTLTQYSFVTWAFVAALFIGATIMHRGQPRDMLEGLVIAYLAPIVYALVLWTLFNAIIVGKPFGWIGFNSSNSLAVNSDQIASPASATLFDVSHRLLQVTVGVAPLALLVIPLLVVLFFVARDVMALWLAGFCALGLALVGADALLQDNLGVITLSDGLPVAVTAFVGAAWLYRSQDTLRGVAWLIAAVMLVLTIPLGRKAMETYPYQALEQAFVRAVDTGHSQEGTASRGGYAPGIDPEREMAAYIDRMVGQGKHAVLTDNAQTYGVILLSGRPQVMFDRVDKGDGTWLALRNNPWGKVRYLLIAYRSHADLIEQRYPQAASGTIPGLTPVYRTSRYVIVAVAPHAPASRNVTSAVPTGAVPQEVTP